MSDSLVESVARALERKANNSAATWNTHPESVRDQWREMAVVAIAAMDGRGKVWDGETLDAMVRAFDANYGKDGLRETLMAVVNARMRAAINHGGSRNYPTLIWKPPLLWRFFDWHFVSVILPLLLLVLALSAIGAAVWWVVR